METYLKINLNDYENGGRVYFYKSMLKHVISLYLNENKLARIKVDSRIEGLPLSNRNLVETQKKSKKMRSIENN